MRDVNGYAEEVTPEALTTLREFFQAENDERLGRWRWAEDPDVVATRVETWDAVMVFNERTWRRVAIHGKDASLHESDEAVRAARAYVEAHQPPKPWLDAKPGEAWVITVHGEELARVVTREGFVGGPFVTPKDSPHIEAGRRIWPKGGATMSTPMQDLPEHLRIGVNANGSGPAEGDDFDHWECWCDDPECDLWKGGDDE